MAQSLRTIEDKQRLIDEKIKQDIDEYKEWLKSNKAFRKFMKPHIKKYDEARGKGWINASDGIPVNQPLIVNMEIYGVWVAVLSQDTGRHKPVWVDIDTNETHMNISNVTHWMPFPAPPENKS